MKCFLLHSRLMVLFFAVIESLSGSSAWCAEKVTLPSAPPPVQGFLQYKPTAAEKDDTYQFLNKQENPTSNMDASVRNYANGKSRAEQMVEMLQNQELTKAFQKITKNGMKTIDENPEIKTPLGVIAGAASLWYGRTVKLIRGEDFNISARMEGRAQRSEFSMASPLVNGRLRFDANEGMGFDLNRSITSLHTEAALQYNTRDQVFSTEVRQKIAPNLDLSFGVSRLDQNTRIEYRLNF